MEDKKDKVDAGLRDWEIGSQWFGYPRVLGTPVPKSLASDLGIPEFWAPPCPNL